MNSAIDQPAPRERSEFDCPICAAYDEVSVIRVGRAFWCVCDRCRVRRVWLVGGRSCHYKPQSRRERAQRRRILQRFTLLTGEE